MHTRYVTLIFCLETLNILQTKSKCSKGLIDVISSYQTITGPINNGTI